MKLDWSGSAKPSTSASGGLVTSVGVGVASTALAVVPSPSMSRKPGRPMLTTVRMDGPSHDPPSGRFRL